MKNPENISNQINKKTSHIHQIMKCFSDKIGKRFNRKPGILEKRRFDKCEKCNRVKVIKSSNGKQYLKITIHPLDKDDGCGTERAEIQAKHNLDYDKKYEQSFSFQLKQDFLLVNPRLVIWQWKRKPAITNDDAPLLSQRIKKKEDWKYYLVFTDGYRDEIGESIPVEEILWKRVDMKYEIKFSDKGKSYIVITATYWWKETKIYEWELSIPHVQEENLDTPQAYFKFWIYRDIKENNQKTSIFFKNYKIKEVDK